MTSNNHNPTDVSPAAQTVTTTDDATTEVKEKVGISLIGAIALNCLLIGAAVFAYHRFIVPKPVSIGLIDVQKIVSVLENQTRKVIVDNLNATDAERNAAAYAFEQKMMTLQKVIKDISNKCNCNLVVKAALLNASSGKAIDYTEEAMNLMGLNNIDQVRPAATTEEAKPKELPSTNASGAPLN